MNPERTMYDDFNDWINVPYGDEGITLSEAMSDTDLSLACEAFKAGYVAGMESVHRKEPYGKFG